MTLAGSLPLVLWTRIVRGRKVCRGHRLAPSEIKKPTSILRPISRGMMTPTGGGSDGQFPERHALLLLFRSSWRLAQAEDSESFFLAHTYFYDFKACRWLVRRAGYSLRCPLSTKTPRAVLQLQLAFASDSNFNSKLFGGFPCFMFILSLKCTCRLQSVLCFVHRQQRFKRRTIPGKASRPAGPTMVILSRESYCLHLIPRCE